MTAVSLATARDTLSELMDQVTREHRPVVIREGDRKAVVMVALEDYEEHDETACLMSDPVLARRLSESLAQLDAGKGTVRQLDLDS
jgi:antitoxin YefM